MATNEKITLNVDLYDNIMTEQKGDYTGRARITGSLHNKEIAARIIKERTEYRQETIENILDLADQKKVEAIAEGKSVVDGVGPPRSTRSVCPTHRDNCCATSSKP